MINGVINVRKEKGMTSFGVVARLRRIFHQKKIGHTGTLDPDAEGVLPVCLGRATHLVEDLSHGTKSYRAVIRLGVTTDTQDLSGTVLEEHPYETDEGKVRSVILSFIGDQKQLPPMYSAIKVNGKKLVDLARRGIEVERKERNVTFHEIQIVSMDLPLVTIDVTCSHGTYIRTLCHDIGQKLGCGAAMASLLRTRVEEFTLDQALTLDEIAGKVEQGELSFVIPIDHFYREYPAVTAPAVLTQMIANGNGVAVSACEKADSLKNREKVRLYTAEGRFAGVYRKQGAYLALVKYYYDNGE